MFHAILTLIHEWFMTCMIVKRLFGSIFKSPAIKSFATGMREGWFKSSRVFVIKPVFFTHKRLLSYKSTTILLFPSIMPAFFDDSRKSLEGVLAFLGTCLSPNGQKTYLGQKHSSTLDQERCTVLAWFYVSFLAILQHHDCCRRGDSHIACKQIKLILFSYTNNQQQRLLQQSTIVKSPRIRTFLDPWSKVYAIQQKHQMNKILTEYMLLRQETTYHMTCHTFQDQGLQVLKNDTHYYVKKEYYKRHVINLQLKRADWNTYQHNRVCNKVSAERHSRFLLQIQSQSVSKYCLQSSLQKEDSLARKISQ